MEAFNVLEDFIGTESLIPTLTEDYNNLLFSKKNVNLLVLAASTALLFLSSGSIFSSCFSTNPLSGVLQNLSNATSGTSVRTTALTEKLKENKWNDWMKQLEEQWKSFHDQMENERKQWLEKKDAQWEKWKKYTEIKYMSYCVDINNEFESNTLKDSSTWNRNQWEDWITTVGKEMIKSEYEKWIYENENYLDEWKVREWVEWKQKNISSWLSSEWKCKEDDSWSKWEQTVWGKWLFTENREKWTAWKERTLRERAEWLKWVQLKEYVYINDEWIPWTKWKNENRLAFIDWIGSFMNEWINNKQWNEWIHERKKMVATKKIAPLNAENAANAASSVGVRVNDTLQSDAPQSACAQDEAE